ncbi:hypothetical protein DES52_1066 [Deinococcus yavapaiensis KR-236]|uniref:Uncharacterized protein n=1 Tax=Deinococcus yavapaiensis KR-236 TaxID=694435 RepID=A0A318S7Q8_9DEIO|nr:hypothetical protein DES52_1066 [Deinococcus yavapaiensis KR-236]
MLPLVFAVNLALSSQGGPPVLFAPLQPYVPGTARVVPIPTCWTSDVVLVQPGHMVYPIFRPDAPRTNAPWDVPCDEQGSRDVDTNRSVPGAFEIPTCWNAAVAPLQPGQFVSPIFRSYAPRASVPGAAPCNQQDFDVDRMIPGTREARTDRLG